jgi:hypothetical protein
VAPPLTFDEWLEAYGRAWREADENAVAEIFTEEGIYRSHPFREPHVGSEAIRAYWRRACGPQEEVDLRFGRPIAAGSRAAVEWWANWHEGGEQRTLAGVLYLRFADDGRCQELREAWHLEPAQLDPPEGWGA